MSDPNRPAGGAGARPLPRPGPLQPGEHAQVALRPVPDAHITGGFWHARRRVNSEASIPAGASRLESAGNLGNLRLAAGQADGSYRGDLPFLDSDVYKWLEAVSWLLASDVPGEEAAASLAARRDDIIGLVGAAQRDDGYVQSWFQVAHPAEPYTNLPWGHELYCAGHLIQAAVAHARATGRDDLLQIACRYADHIDAALGPDGQPGVDGHPEIETALVELYRYTGEQRYLTLARHLIDQRGHGLIGDGRFGRAYWQDHAPLRDATAVAGHAVRQLYLLAGAADVYAETGDEQLLAAVVRLWEDMAATRAYLTGGIGSHHTDEAFGDPYELPPERAYTETCAAIASVMVSWRLLLITGQARYADLLERTLYNGFLAGISLDGLGYLYVNPLQVRPGSGGAPDDPNYHYVSAEHAQAGYAGGAGDQSAGRKPWFRCACCPPNIMRLIASLQHYLVAASPDGLWLSQYATGSFAAEVAGRQTAIQVTTDYPWQGEVRVEVTATGPGPWGLRLRVPGWCGQPRLTVNGEPANARPAAGWLTVTRQWQPGDVAVLDLPMPVRLTEGHPRTDAVRGCLAAERGPLVYCLEQADLPGIRLDDVAIDAGAPLAASEQPGLLGGVVTVTGPGYLRRPARPGGLDRTSGPDGAGGSPASRDGDGTSPASRDGDAGSPDGQAGQQDWWPYRPAGSARPQWDEVTLTAVPYFAWANRGPGAMRVWIPRRPPP